MVLGTCTVLFLRRVRTGYAFLGLGALDTLNMLGRYVVSVAADPDRCWLTGTVPIRFHPLPAASTTP